MELVVVPVGNVFLSKWFERLLKIVADNQKSFISYSRNVYESLHINMVCETDRHNESPALYMHANVPTKENLFSH